MSCLKHSCLLTADDWKFKGENWIVSSQGVLCSRPESSGHPLGFISLCLPSQLPLGRMPHSSSCTVLGFAKIQEVCNRLGELENNHKTCIGARIWEAVYGLQGTVTYIITRRIYSFMQSDHASI